MLCYNSQEHTLEKHPGNTWVFFCLGVFDNLLFQKIDN